MKTANNKATVDSFTEEIRQAIMRHSMLAHPFYQAWSAGTLNKTILREYAKQYYAHVRAFPTYVSAVHSHCQDLTIRQQLLENLIEEERGPENHPELWLRFGEGLGVKREELRSAQLLPATQNSVESFQDLTRSEDYREGLAALYAYESQIPEVARTKRAGLESFYGIEDSRATSFFTVHKSIDLLHQQSELEILAQVCDTLDAQARAVTGAEKAAVALTSFLDGVTAAYLAPAN